jgi:hypothetical protein
MMKWACLKKTSMVFIDEMGVFMLRSSYVIVLSSLFCFCVSHDMLSICCLFLKVVCSQLRV